MANVYLQNESFVVDSQTYAMDMHDVRYPSNWIRSLHCPPPVLSYSFYLT